MERGARSVPGRTLDLGLIPIGIRGGCGSLAVGRRGGSVFDSLRPVALGGRAVGDRSVAIAPRPGPVQSILRSVAWALGCGLVPVHGLEITLRRKIVAELCGPLSLLRGPVPGPSGRVPTPTCTFRPIHAPRISSVAVTHKREGWR